MSESPEGPPTPPREDPGWSAPGRREILAAVVPGMLPQVTEDLTLPAIVGLRRILLGFAVALSVFLVVLALLVPVAPGSIDHWLAWTLVGLGTLISIGGPSSARRRRLVCAKPSSIAQQVSAAMFFGLATAQSAALLGFVAAFVIDALWPYLVALAPTAIGLIRVAPSRSRVAEFDRRLATVGCHLTASQVLYALPGDPAHPTNPDGPANGAGS